MPTTDRTVLVRIKGDASDLVRAAMQGKAAIASLGDSIDKTNDRTAWLAQGVLALAPAVTTLGAGAVPVLSGLATQMTVGAAAAGVMALGFNGIGDSLSALNDYQLDPTAENLDKLNEAMSKVGESGESFVRFLDHVAPKFAELSNAARGSMFPGIEEGIENFMVLLPQVERIVSEIGAGIGDIAASAGADLAGPEWQEFWDFLESDARPILVELSNTIGNFAQGMGSLIAAFAPLTRDFSTGFEDMSRSFADWAATVDETKGFQEFLAYVREAGPMALDFIGSLVMAFAEIVEAAAPVGAVMLPALTGLLDVIADLAATPLGPIVLGFTALTSAWGRLNALAAITGSGVLGKATQGIRDNAKAAVGAAPSVRQFGNSLDFLSGPLSRTIHMTGETEKHYAGLTAKAKEGRTAMGKFGRAAGPIAGQVGLLAVSMSGLDNQLGLTNTTTLALAGSMAGPWGAAVGAAIGFAMDMTAATRATTEAIKGWQIAMDTAVASGNVDAQAAIVAQARAEVNALTADVADMSFGEGITTALQGKFGLDTEYDDLARLQAALAELEGEHEKGKRAADKMGAAINGMYSGMGNEQIAAARASGAQKRHAAALEQVRAAARESAEAFVGLGGKLDKGKVSLDDWIKSLQKQADALRDFRVNTERAAEKGLNKGLIKALHEAGPAGAMRMKQLADGTEKQIDRANEAWKSQRRQVELFGNALGVLPNGKRVDITVTGLKESIDDTHRLYNALADIRSKTVTVTTVFTKDGRYFKDDAGAQADGGTIGGARHPYGDKLLTWLAPGEEVISNRWGQADRHRDLLKAINANRLADGGTIGHLLAAQPSVNVAPAALSLAGARFVLEVPGMGQVMTRVVRSEMAAEGRFRERLDDRD